MIQRLRTWPRMIGVSLSVVTFGVLCFASGDLLLLRGVPDGGVRVDEFVAIAACVLAFVLSYFLYTARDFARRILFGVFAVFGLYSCVMVIIRIRGSFMITGDLSPADRRDIVSQGIIEAVGAACIVLAPVAFFMFLLCHRDVAAAFRHSDATNRGGESV